MRLVRSCVIGVGMSAYEQGETLVVVRGDAGSGGVGLRLVGELDLNTVELLETALVRTGDQAPPGVIDLTELRFLDLAGLRALLRAVSGEGAGAARLVGATGVVRRLFELTHTLGPDSAHTPTPLPSDDRGAGRLVP
jgi:anti-anti-sigma factor